MWHLSLVHRAVALLHQHQQRLPGGDWPNFVFLAPFQDADRFQGYGNVGAQPVLSVPGGTVDGDSGFCYFQKWFIVIDHGGPLPQQLPPEPGVGRLARAAFRGEEVGPPVHGHHAAMEQQGTEVKELLRDFPLDGDGFQVGICVLPRLPSLQNVLPDALLPLKCDVLVCNPHGELRFFLAQIFPEEFFCTFFSGRYPGHPARQLYRKFLHVPLLSVPG